jgi:hypothetical protein
MMKLSQEAFQRAKAYLTQHGRELDKHLFGYLFEKGNKSAVIIALTLYQNDDGGFGNALEPDLRTPASSAIATQQAFNYFREIDATGDEKTVQNGVDYLLNTFDSEAGVWPIVPPEVEDAPHAPWWSHEDSAKNFGGFLVNPRAALIGHLHFYATLVPADFLTGVSAEVLHHLEGLPDDKMDNHDFQCYLTLAGSLKGSDKSSVISKLSKSASTSVQSDPSQWTDYNLKPLAVAPAPGSPLSFALDRQAIDDNLDHEISRQLADGSWPLTWSWEFVDETAWTQAEKEWKGHHIVQILKTLKAYDRIEN